MATRRQPHSTLVQLCGMNWMLSKGHVLSSMRFYSLLAFWFCGDFSKRISRCILIPRRMWEWHQENFVDKDDVNDGSCGGCSYGDECSHHLLYHKQLLRLPLVSLHPSMYLLLQEQCFLSYSQQMLHPPLYLQMTLFATWNVIPTNSDESICPLHTCFESNSCKLAYTIDRCLISQVLIAHNLMCSWQPLATKAPCPNVSQIVTFQPSLPRQSRVKAHNLIEPKEMPRMEGWHRVPFNHHGMGTVDSTTGLVNKIWPFSQCEWTHSILHR